MSSVSQDMLHKKLHDFLVKGDLCGYRLLLSRQHSWLRKCKVAPVPALLATSDAKTDFEGMVEEFLLQYLCFTSYVSFVDTFLGCDLPGVLTALVVYSLHIAENR